MNALGLALLFGHLSALLVVHLLLPNLGHLHAISGGNLPAVFLFRLLRLNIQIMKTIDICTALTSLHTSLVLVVHSVAKYSSGSYLVCGTQTILVVGLHICLTQQLLLGKYVIRVEQILQYYTYMLKAYL